MAALDSMAPNPKRCTACRRDLPRSEFYRNKQAKDGLYAYCKTCSKDRARGWKQENIDRNRELARAFKHRREYGSWSCARARCYDQSNEKFASYGARGIRMCDAWRDDFHTFLRDMGTAPSGCTLDRIDVDGNYEPDNCRWATPTQQANNRRCNIVLEFQGRSQTVAEWAHELGLPDKRIYARVKRGWSPERCLT